MIGPDRYQSMLADRHAIPMAWPGAERAMMPGDADRLEAALDSALIRSTLAARDGGTWIAPTGDSYGVCVRVPLKDLRDWLGDETLGYGYGTQWRWTKAEIEYLFADEVMPRYMASGWDVCKCEWDSPQERSMRFTFRTREPRTARGAVDATPRDRASAALAGLGSLLGVGEGKPPAQLRDDGMAEYLESLRLAAAYLRFDLEVTRQEALDANHDHDNPGPR